MVGLEMPHIQWEISGGGDGNILPVLAQLNSTKILAMITYHRSCPRVIGEQINHK